MIGEGRLIGAPGPQRTGPEGPRHAGHEMKIVVRAGHGADIVGKIKPRRFAAAVIKMNCARVTGIQGVPNDPQQRRQPGAGADQQQVPVRRSRTIKTITVGALQVQPVARGEVI